MSLQAYAGEFTVSPIPLELTMNYCSHKCAYCFANLNQPDRKYDAKSTIRALAARGGSLCSELIKSGAPILLSNRTDPFANSNYKQAAALIELTNQMGIKLAFQTKGGRGIEDAIAALSYRAHWYISIAFTDDKLREKIEPGATPIEERITLAKRLKALGHGVAIGINPLVEEWMDANQFERLLKRLLDIGIADVWISPLHLNKKQVSRMSDRERAAIGPEVIAAAGMRKANILQAYYQYGVEMAIELGMNVYGSGQPYRSDYFKEEHEIYENTTIKTNQDFVNWCFDNLNDGDEVKFADYYMVMAPQNGLYEKTFTDADGYAYRIARNIYNREEIIDKPFKTLRDVLRFYWNNPEIRRSVGANPLFQVVAYEEKGKIYPYFCHDNDAIVYRFNRQATAEEYFLTD